MAKVPYLIKQRQGWYAEVAEKDELSAKVYQSYLDFRRQVVDWHDISERAYLNLRQG